MRSEIKKLYSVSQIRELEACAIKAGISGDQLMAQAGRAAFDCMTETWIAGNSIVVFCGGGNNGGDGYVLAQLASERGLKVSVRYVGDIAKLQHEALQAMQACQKAGVTILPFNPNEEIQADVFVDALLGIGLSGEVRGDYLAAIAWINRQKANIFSIDIPSGVHADTGEVLGVAVKADMTMTFIGAKQGLFTGDALDYCGTLFCDDLDVSSACFQSITAHVDILNQADYMPYLKPRLKNSHKGMFGHVLVVGGGLGMSGAVRLSALGAARTGAGLVTVATRPEHVGFVNVMQPELMAYGVSNSGDLLPLLDRATVVVIGPGLGRSEWARELLATVLASHLPVVIDADALNLLADEPAKNANWILTPHPGEAARLLKMETEKVQQDRFNAVKLLQERYDGLAVLKGAGTLVRDLKDWHVCTAGNPGMASAGMGDVLSGIIGGLVAQGLSLSSAADLGVCVHAKAGDRASMKGQRGLLATDLLPEIRELVNE